jgi:hypothetical protein
VATFGDAGFVLNDSKGVRLGAGVVVTFTVVANSVAGGPAMKCNNVPASATTDSNGIVMLKGITATVWPGDCVITATSTATKGSTYPTSVATLTATYAGTLPTPPILGGLTKAQLDWFNNTTAPLHIAIYADIDTTGTYDTPYYHSVCGVDAAPGGGNKIGLGDHFNTRMNIGVTWPLGWPATQTLQLTYLWTPTNADPAKATVTLSPTVNNIGGTSFTGFLKGKLYPDGGVVQHQLQVAIVAIDGNPVMIKQNDMSGKRGVAISFGCYGQFNTRPQTPASDVYGNGAVRLP